MAKKNGSKSVSRATAPKSKPARQTFSSIGVSKETRTRIAALVGKITPTKIRHLPESVQAEFLTSGISQSGIVRAGVAVLAEMVERGK